MRARLRRVRTPPQRRFEKALMAPVMGPLQLVVHSMGVAADPIQEGFENPFHIL
jgi:hypothetical protein